MRPTVYGKEIIFNLRGDLLGINLGFNYYCEHECGTEELVHGVNMHAYPEGVTPMQYKKLDKAAAKAMKKWSKTPIAGHVFVPSSQIFTRKIIIDNSECDPRLPYRQLQDGNYTLFALNGCVNSAPVYWSRRLYMPDYNPCRRNFMLDDFAASWGSDGLMLLIRDSGYFSSERLIKDLTEAIMRNALACVPQHGAFHQHGCTLVVVDKMPDTISPLELRQLVYQS